MAETYQDLLERETRPIFEDEVDSVHRSAFKVIDEIEYPSYSTLDDKMLALIWYEVDNLEFEDVYPLSQLDGVGLLAAYEIPDDPMSWDEDVSNGWFWLPTKESLESLGSSLAFIPKVFSRSL